VRIPADVDRPDRVLGPLTARQVTILGVGALVSYGGWAATRTVVAPLVFFVLAVPVVAGVVVLAVGERDGISLDRLLLAAIGQRLGARLRVSSPGDVRRAPGWLAARATSQGQAPVSGAHRAPAALRLPVGAVTDTGVLDLGADGVAVVAVASTVNFALRTPTEQDALVAVFGAYLHSLAAPVQILVRTHRLDLSGPITELREQAGALAHPALEAAALEHAEHLAELAAGSDLLRRQVLLILREPLRPALAGTRGRRGASRRDEPALSGARRAAEARLVRRLGEALELLAPAGIQVSLLDPGQATAVLAAACDPATLVPSTGMAGADQIITTPTSAAAAATPIAEHRWYPTAPTDPTPSRGDDPDDHATDDDWTDDDWTDDDWADDDWADDVDGDAVDGAGCAR
jgi:hypothetical protein